MTSRPPRRIVEESRPGKQGMRGADVEGFQAKESATIMSTITKIVRRRMAAMTFIAFVLAGAAIICIHPGIPWAPDGGFGWGFVAAGGETVKAGPEEGGFGWGDSPMVGGEYGDTSAGAAPPVNLTAL
ncbi:hypothetical protein [Sphaerisporangium dianthi]|uniref:Uncharacterized protein n=1 Tax=Sphaerisporangium dianthi TaxID=1436120 RepID=A0ABV9CD92_9ACTN